MKKLLFTVLGIGMLISAQAQNTTRLNLIHNVADADFANVSLWAAPLIAPTQEEQILPSISFRQSTGFFTPDPLSVGIPLIIKIKPVGATASTPALFETQLTIPQNQTTIVVANGTNSAVYNPNPGISLNVFTNARETSTNPANTDVLVVHGSTDAPAVDVLAQGVPTPLVSNLTYPQFQGYLELPTADYILGINPAGTSTTLVNYFAPLQTLDLSGKAVTVVASGFLNPALNNNGEAFGLWVALPDEEDLTPLPVFTPLSGPAKLQVIHNAADPAAAEVDIYVNGTLTLDNFAFREATDFIELPAGSYTVGIAPGNSTSAADIIATFDFDLDADQAYIAVANGVLNPADFDASVNSIAFNVFPYVGARTQSVVNAEVDILVFHGATDAPAVDILTGGNVLVPNLSYGNFAGYLGVDPAEYILQIAPAGTTTPVASFVAPLGNAAGQSVVVLASGFLNPAANQDGAAFGLLAVFADGTEVLLPAFVEPTPTAKLQIIHNAADPAAAVVDLYVNGDLFRDNFGFREATAFVELPAGTYAVGVAPGNSTSVSDVIATFNFDLEAGESYIAVANGVLNPADFDASVNSIAFNVFPFVGARLQANEPDKIDLLVFHGATDAPAVDVRTAGTVLVSDIAYGEFDGYITVDPGNYILDITPAGSTTPVAQFSAPLSTAVGAAATVLASGFLNPEANQDGTPFGLIAVLADGTVITLPPFTSSVAESGFSAGNVKLFPNPVTELLNIELNMQTAQVLNVDMIDMNGAIVRTIQGFSAQEGYNLLNLDVNGISSGFYTLRIANGNVAETIRVIVR